MAKRFFTIQMLFLMLCVLLAAPSFAYLCGNGVLEVGEVCDDGENNSDVAPDSCRTDCRFAYCGDNVVDSGEQCDGHNYETHPNKCRRDCTLPYCGDGIRDDGRMISPPVDFFEECDDGNSDNFDGCTDQCKKCLAIRDDLMITETPGIPLCSQQVEIKDAGQEGIVIIDGFDVTLDCNNATIIGIGGMEQLAPSVSGNISNIFSGGSSSSGSSSSNNNPSNSGSTGNKPINVPAFAPKRGTGILVKGDGAVLMNCYVQNFGIGLKLESGGATVKNSHFCGNHQDVWAKVFTNFGEKNHCNKTTNWFEGVVGCQFKCDKSVNTEKIDSTCFSGTTDSSGSEETATPAPEAPEQKDSASDDKKTESSNQMQMIRPMNAERIKTRPRTIRAIR